MASLFFRKKDTSPRTVPAPETAPAPKQQLQPQNVRAASPIHVHIPPDKIDGGSAIEDPIFPMVMQRTSSSAAGKKEKERLSSRGEEMKIKKQDSINKETQIVTRPISPTMEFSRSNNQASSPPAESALASESKHSRLIAEIDKKNTSCSSFIKKYLDDAEDFSQVNRQVATLLERAKEPAIYHTLPQAQLETLYTLLQELEQQFMKNDKAGNLRRYLTSNYLRPRLEHLNVGISSSTEILLLGCEPGSGKHSPIIPSLRLADLKLASEDQPEEGARFWAAAFGAENVMAEWNSFVKALTSYTSLRYAEDELKTLRAVLDHGKTGFVSASRFCEFLRGFGLIKDAVAAMKRIVQERWFYGYLTSEEASMLLSGQSAGTYLVRFSRSRPGSFALAVSYSKTKVIPVLITGAMPRGLQIMEQGGNISTFPNLYAIIENYKHILKRAYTSNLAREPWFCGDMSKEEAEEMLADQRVGTFIIRFSDAANEVFCASYVADTKTIQHTYMKTDQLLTTGHMIPQEQKATIIAMIHEFIKTNREILRYNYDNEGIPTLRMRRHPADSNIVAQISGPGNPNIGGEASCKNGAGKSVSTYPDIPAVKWQPICDVFELRQTQHRTLFSIADGCGWGEPARLAACCATDGFMKYLMRMHSDLLDVREAGKTLLLSLYEAHEAILKGARKEDVELQNVGTTTFLGGICMELSSEERDKFACVIVSIGDCKAFHWKASDQSITDITLGNRAELDVRDPGGRIGPHLRNGAPDVRNLKLFFVPCEEGDMFIAMTDGIHDNLDPEMLGKTPPEIYPNASAATWRQLPFRESWDLKNKYKPACLQTIIDAARERTPHGFLAAVIEHTLQSTNKAKTFTEQSGGKLSTDYKEYPGKMDHATGLVFRVGPY